MIVRKSKAEDFARIQAIYEEIQHQKIDVSKNKDEDCFVAELDGKVVGFVIGYGLTGSFGVEKSAWLAMVGVDPRHMGEKIGQQLAREALSYYKEMGYDSVHVSVQWDATDLLSFFKTLGFDRSKFLNLEKKLG